MYFSVLFILCILTSFRCLANCQNIVNNSVKDEIVINKVVDELLKFVRIVIRDEDVDRVAIPNLNVEFTGPLAIKGIFNASNGSVAYLSSVYRTGDARISIGRTTTTVYLDLGVEQLVIDYNSYSAKFLSIGPTGKMRATIGRNSLYVTISLVYNFYNCSEEVGVVQMVQFDDIDVKLTGLDPLNWLLDDIAAWIAKDFRDNIKSLVEDNIRQAIKTALSKYNLCKYLPHKLRFMKLK